MFQKMRRADRQATQDECIAIIKSSSAGVLSLNGTDGYPYGVPLNYMYSDGALYFHCAKEGEKLARIAHDNRACFTVIGRNEVLPEAVSTNYQSVIIFGDIGIIADDKQKRDILMDFGVHFGCEREMLEKYVVKSADACHVLKLDIAHMSGKARK